MRSPMEKENSVTAVRALFMDYDGTISPINVSRLESRVPLKIMSVLNRISEHIPVAVITNKPLEFIIARTPFACAWSALGGLEAKIAGITYRAPCLKTTRNLEAALHYATRKSEGLLTVEEKPDSEGKVVAFSVDWRFANNSERAEKAAMRILSFIKSLHVVTFTYTGQPFFDVFPCVVDKGKALLDLKQKLGVLNNVMYMGDSASDNPAFELAEVAVGVINEETPKNLACKYFVRFELLADFLLCLIENDFLFNPDFPMVLDKQT